MRAYCAVQTIVPSTHESLKILRYLYTFWSDSISEAITFLNYFETQPLFDQMSESLYKKLTFI